ncbi:MAG TPA: class D sortase, partial [Candidatus Saccharimonadales bacterium]|nr:class D sortase [Candidatus Saccharimonadales bacterium]
DADKHKVWQEFYSTQAQTAHHPAVTHQPVISAPATPVLERPSAPKRRSKTAHKLSPAKSRVKENQTARKVASNRGLHSLLFGLGTGSIVIIIFLFSFFNERIIAPFIQPSRNAGNIQFISDAPVSQDPEVIIPKINVEIPVVYGVNTINDNAVETALENGVVHYADTADPGQDGNAVIVGHSSNNLFNAGKYKFAFVLLHDLVPGDTFYLQKDGKRYTYQVYKKEIVSPTDVSVLGPTNKLATASLITCDPPGTSTNRLVVIGEQISPDPSTNLAASTQNKLATSANIIPGNSTSLWSRLVNWFTQ